MTEFFYLSKRINIELYIFKKSFITMKSYTECNQILCFAQKRCYPNPIVDPKKCSIGKNCTACISKTTDLW